MAKREWRERLLQDLKLETTRGIKSNRLGLLSAPLFSFASVRARWGFGSFVLLIFSLSRFESSYLDESLPHVILDDLDSARGR